MGTSISERALLVSLNISQWTARRLDRKETRSLNARHGLTVEAARVNKNLLPMAAELDRVHQTTAAIRKEFAKRTLPWTLEGVCILNAEAYMDFSQEVTRWQNDWYSAVDGFIDAYPQYRKEAELMLGTLFDADDYPEAESLRKRFAFSIRFLPMPEAGDFRIDIGDEAVAALRERLEADVQKSVGEAMQVAWQRVHDVVSKAHERLSNPENIFRDSLVENARELCAILPSLNITKDPELEKARQQIERSLCKHEPATLRDDTAVRADVADQMKDVMSKMAGFFG